MNRGCREYLLSQFWTATGMQTIDQDQPAAGTARLTQWSVWIVPFFVGALLLAAVVGVVFWTVGGRWNVCTLLGWLGLAFVAVLMVGVKAACHSIRGRSDATHLWKDRFPTHTQGEIQRFIRVVGESFGFRARHWSKLRPDDHLSDIRHQWSGGDGMELVELVMHVEREYSVQLPEEFLTMEKTLGELFVYVARPAPGQSRLSGAGPSDQGERRP